MKPGNGGDQAASTSSNTSTSTRAAQASGVYPLATSPGHRSSSRQTQNRVLHKYLFRDSTYIKAHVLAGFWSFLSASHSRLFASKRRVYVRSLYIYSLTGPNINTKAFKNNDLRRLTTKSNAPMLCMARCVQASVSYKLRGASLSQKLLAPLRGTRRE